MTTIQKNYRQTALAADTQEKTGVNPLFEMIFATGFIALHIPLGLLMDVAPIVSTIHGYLSLLVGLWFVLIPGKEYRLAYVLSYIAGAEVLWRMTKASIFWEYGKYGTVLLILLIVWRTRTFRIPMLPLVYFLMLIPSLIFIVMTYGMGEARNAISFNLSGPLALFLCATYFSNVKFTEKQLQYALIMIIAPTVCIGAIAYSGIAGTDIVWIGDSNSATSGGFGPNQVSTALGLGVFCGWVLIFLIGRPIVFPPFTILITGWLAIQTLLTFSRGGMLGAILAIIATVGVMVVNRKINIKNMVVGAIGMAVFGAVVYPAVNAFTGGALGLRYGDIGVNNTSGRDQIAAAELQVFYDNIPLGAGVGQASRWTPHNLPPHTEYTRLLAEHGYFGIAALLLMVLMGAHVYFSNGGNSQAQALAVAMVAWAVFYMMNSAMRTVAGSYMFGFAFAAFYFFEKQKKPKNDKKRPHHR